MSAPNEPINAQRREWQTVPTLKQYPTEIVYRPFMGYIVYGWNYELYSSTDGRFIPLRLFVSMHSWKWCARRAERRWLDERARRTAFDEGDR